MRGFYEGNQLVFYSVLVIDINHSRHDMGMDYRNGA